MGRNLVGKVKKPRSRGIEFKGSAPKGWEQNPWSLPEEERQSCGFYKNCNNSKKCGGYGKVKSSKKKFFAPCASYSWPLETPQNRPSAE